MPSWREKRVYSENVSSSGAANLILQWLWKNFPDPSPVSRDLDWLKSGSNPKPEWGFFQNNFHFSFGCSKNSIKAALKRTMAAEGPGNKGDSAFSLYWFSKEEKGLCPKFCSLNKKWSAGETPLAAKSKQCKVFVSNMNCFPKEVWLFSFKIWGMKPWCAWWTLPCPGSQQVAAAQQSQGSGSDHLAWDLVAGLGFMQTAHLFLNAILALCWPAQAHTCQKKWLQSSFPNLFQQFLVQSLLAELVKRDCKERTLIHIY